MKCGKPIAKEGLQFGCGQCMPCRFNKARLWTARILLETCYHEENSFVTLTYSPEAAPQDGNVSVREVAGFLKRARAMVHPRRVRYFCVGEYGDTSWRPHYHCALFGLCDESVVEAAWARGHVDVGEITAESARYIAGYTVKRMTNGSDPRLGGRAPEFARMSLRPGIGAVSVDSIQDGVTTRAGARFVAGAGDVPGTVRFGQKTWPIGRYLKGRLRESLGMDQGCPDAVLAMARRAVRDAYVEAGMSSKAFVELVEGQRLQSVRGAEARASVQRTKRKV